jgi:hypothetical protein
MYSQARQPRRFSVTASQRRAKLAGSVMPPPTSMSSMTISLGRSSPMASQKNPACASGVPAFCHTNWYMSSPAMGARAVRWYWNTAST